MKNKFFFFRIVVYMTLMDVINFREFDSFLFQITNSGWDFWHLLKLILYIDIFCFLFDREKLKNYGKASIELFIYFGIAVVPHWFILHYLF